MSTLIFPDIIRRETKTGCRNWTVYLAIKTSCPYVRSKRSAKMKWIPHDILAVRMRQRTSKLQSFSNHRVYVDYDVPR